jgi:hypothetical protein
VPGFPRFAPAVGGLYPHLKDEVRRVPPARIDVVVDATGAGTPAVDILRLLLRERGIRVNEAGFTFGRTRISEIGGPRSLPVGKEYLVSRLQALLQTRRIELPAGKVRPRRWRGSCRTTRSGSTRTVTRGSTPSRPGPMMTWSRHWDWPSCTIR